MNPRFPVPWLVVLAALGAACAREAREDPLLTLRRWEDHRTLLPDSLGLLLESAPWRVRAAGCRAVGRIGDPAGLTLLEQRLVDDDHPQVRREAAFALGILAQPEAAPTLVRQLGRELDVGALGEIVLALGRLEDAPDGTTAALLPWAMTGHPHVREQALEALALRADSTSVDVLLQATYDDVESVVWRAAYALEKLPRTIQVPRLVELTAHPSSLVRRYALRSLGRLQAHDAASAIAAAAAGASDDWQVRVMAADALGRVGGDAAVEALLTLLGDEIFHVRAAALAGLGRIGSAQASAPIEALLADPCVDVRMAAADALAECAGEAAAGPLQSLLEDPSPLVVGVCLARLGDVAPQTAAGVLGPWLEAHPQSSQRYRAIEGLGAAGEAVPLEVLLRALSEPDWVVVTTAVDQLAQRGDSSVVPTLLETYRRAERPGRSDICLQILQSLGGLGDLQAVPLLEEALRQESDVRLRLAARASLVELLAPAEAALLPSERDIRRQVRPVRRSSKQPPVVVRSRAAQLVLHTDRGRILIDLLGEDAPQTVESFGRLAQQGFFDRLTFHRVVPNFVIQGGDPLGNGWGDAGYTLRSEWHWARYERGTVGIAHSGKDTGSCQLFITHSPQPHLNGRYTIFGQVAQGMEVVDAIQMGDRFRAEILWSER